MSEDVTVRANIETNAGAQLGTMANGWKEAGAQARQTEQAVKAVGAAEKANDFTEREIASARAFRHKERMQQMVAQSKLGFLGTGEGQALVGAGGHLATLGIQMGTGQNVSGAQIGQGVGGALGLAGMAIPGVGPVVGMMLSQILGQVGGAIGGAFDKSQADKEKAEKEVADKAKAAAEALEKAAAEIKRLEELRSAGGGSLDAASLAAIAGAIAAASKPQPGDQPKPEENLAKAINDMLLKQAEATVEQKVLNGHLAAMIASGQLTRAQAVSLGFKAPDLLTTGGGENPMAAYYGGQVR